MSFGVPIKVRSLRSHIDGARIRAVGDYFTVVWSVYWARRLRDGDIEIIIDAPAPARPRPTKKEA